MKDIDKVAEGEEVVVICSGSSNTRFTDNKHGHCAECGSPIVWRPHVPEPSTKLCVDCGFKAMNEAEAAGEEIEHATNQRQKAEIEAIFGPGAVAVGHAMMDAMRKWGGKK